MLSFSGIVVRNIKIALESCERNYDEAAFEKASRALRAARIPVSFNAQDFSVFKKSVDARRKDQIYFVYSVFLKLSDMSLDDKGAIKLSEICKKNGFAIIDSEGLCPDDLTGSIDFRPVVAGFGPCGMFCALVLAKAGARPIVIERGDDVDTRALRVEEYWNKGILDTESNVQFGEGGAGTFSDGKLLTRINDKFCTYVLESFCKYGADESILRDAKPHIGTDKLREIIKNIRHEIIRLGGEVHFRTKLCGMSFDSTGRVISVSTSCGDIPTKSVFLALGHSARDSFSMLLERGFDIKPKAFSVGVRVEHLQENINKSLYGKFYGNPSLPQGEYALSCHIGDRAVYSFCMCPGGTVVASASAKGEIVTNGMSYSARDGRNANSAIAVSVRESDFGDSVEGAIEYQSRIENAAFTLCGSDGSAPYMTLGDFLGKTKGSEPSDVIPTYTGTLKNCNIRNIFPEYISTSLENGFSVFEKQIEGFSSSSAILTAPETRTSSPVRIVRNIALESDAHPGVYPCGEGAGYAGGITSAAVDGIRCALEFISKYKL